ncbi:hypothetical protein [Bradyrhizobium sp. RT4b]|uniref:hypothetical protein n=1 Tax=Bradyrhizobium sp. RT4b TaxID=3156379 RepID=UPI003393A9FB
MNEPDTEFAIDSEHSVMPKTKQHVNLSDPNLSALSCGSPFHLLLGYRCMRYSGSSTRSLLAPLVADLAKEYSARTVPEGVESHTDLIAVTELGFDLVQGHLFGTGHAAEAICVVIFQHSSTSSKLDA